MTFLWLLLLAAAACQADEACSRLEARSLQFEFISSSNGSGFWHSKLSAHRCIQLPHEREAHSCEWKLDLGQVAQDNANAVHISTEVLAGPIKDDDNFQFFEGVGWYRIFTEPKSWDDAQEICVNHTSHLVVINSQEEAQVLMDILREYPNLGKGDSRSNKQIWVGIKDDAKTREFRAVTGEKLEDTGYAVWEKGEPNNAAPSQEFSEDCVGMQRNGRFNDDMCKLSTGFICEKQW